MMACLSAFRRSENRALLSRLRLRLVDLGNIYLYWSLFVDSILSFDLHPLNHPSGVPLLDQG